MVFTGARWRRWVTGAAALGVVATLASIPGVGAPAPEAYAAGGSQVYIDEPLQGGSLSNWTLQGHGNITNESGAQTGAWKPHRTTVAQNNTIKHSDQTNNCGLGVRDDCTASYEPSRDGKWLTLTTDDTTNNGGGQAGTALHNTPFAPDLGVVIEYDQRVYRTNNGHKGGTPANQGGGDGIASTR